MELNLKQELINEILRSKRNTIRKEELWNFDTKQLTEILKDVIMNARVG